MTSLAEMHFSNAEYLLWRLKGVMMCLNFVPFVFCKFPIRLFLYFGHITRPLCPVALYQTLLIMENAKHCSFVL